MRTLLDQTPFQTDLSGFGQAVQSNLAMAKQRQAAAGDAFSRARIESFGQQPAQPNITQSGPSQNVAGFNENVPMSLIQSESGGNWGAQNDATGHGGAKGHFGILQFGHARLEDARRAGAIPPSMSAEEFKRNRDAQIAAANWHFNDIDNRIRQSGFDRLVGQTIGGVPLSMNGMRAMAHLGGFGGLSKFINTNGRYNPSDVNATSLRAYGIQHKS
jgi:hypothetical protein